MTELRDDVPSGGVALGRTATMIANLKTPRTRVVARRMILVVLLSVMALACRRAREKAHRQVAPAEQSTATVATSAPAIATKDTPPPARSAATVDRCRDLVPGDSSTMLAPAPPGFVVRGLDTSTPIPWQQLSAGGLEFALVQAMFGASENPHFATNWRMASACGMKRGAYHFITHRADPTLQARRFVSAVQRNGAGELGPIVDVERPPGCASECCDLSCDDWATRTAIWLRDVEQALGVEPLVYTVEGFWKECLCNTSRFADHDLWLAGYPRFDAAPRPGFGGWQEWAFYQHKGNVRVGKGVIDLNVFRGSREDFSALSAASSN